MSPLNTEKSPTVELEPHVSLPRANVTPRRVRRPKPWKKKVSSLSRWLHVYLSMISFAILFFFAATGITVNHPDWFSTQQHTQQFQGSVNPEWVTGAGEDSVDRLDVVEYLRNTHGIKGALSDFRIDDWQVSVSFSGPGYAADAFIDRETGEYDLTESQMGFVAVINDLHKGRDTGTAWKWLIDVSAVLMTLVSLTGMVLVFFVPRVRSSGIVVAVAGTILAIVVYALWVP